MQDGSPPRRRVPLAGASNFRDLGGYRTADGRTVRWGRLYRSGNLADLTPADVATLRGLELRLVCDLQTAAEREGRASRLPEEKPPTFVHVPIYVEAMDPAVLRQQILNAEVSAERLARTVTAANRAYVTDHSDALAAVFRHVADAASLPCLVHCTQGKDRTGFAAALLLLALGVPVETVLEDYQLSNVCNAALTRRTLRRVLFGTFFRVRPSAMRPLLEARPEYLRAALDAIAERWGSVDVYLREALGVTDAMRGRLRDTLLE